VLLFVTVAMGFVWHAPEPAQDNLRVLTYNTKAAQLLERTGDIAPIEREIVAHRPDIVVLQDANGVRHWRGYDPKARCSVWRMSLRSASTLSPAAGLRDCAVVQVAAGAEPLVRALQRRRGRRSLHARHGPFPVAAHGPECSAP
jgi:hypothetical protein